VDFSGEWSLDDLFFAIRLYILCHHVHLANDLAAFYLQRRFDPHPDAVRVVARLPKRHPILAYDLSLETVRPLLAEDRSQMLGYLRFFLKLEG
jgi:hypothetical protein